jgi:hypothetical protein
LKRDFSRANVLLLILVTSRSPFEIQRSLVQNTWLTPWVSPSGYDEIKISECSLILSPSNLLWKVRTPSKTKGFYVKKPKKEGIEMRRFGILITLICLTLIVPQVAFSQGKKGEYQKRIETKLKEFKQNLEELKGMAGELKQEAKEEFDQGMKELKKKEEAANMKLKELKSAETKTWEKIKAEMEKAIDELEKQYDKVKFRFKKT